MPDPTSPDPARSRFPWREVAVVFLLWTSLVALMTSLVALSTNGLPTYEPRSTVAPGQVPHFVCTADGDGRILRCVFSSIARRDYSTSSSSSTSSGASTPPSSDA